MVIDTAANNKRIAKNTLMLYFRMLFSMLVSLYTSRVVLQVLGVEDYGIYNVVGGFVAMFSLLSSSLSVAIQRFLTFELGKNENLHLSEVFSTSINLLLFLSLLIIILAESFGLWYINNVLNYPPQRVNAVNVIFQISLITFIINLLSIPYSSLLAAYEKFNVYALVSILEVVLKLIVVLVLEYFSFDKLIIYSLLLLLVAIIIRMIYVIYINKSFHDIRYKIKIDFGIVREMFGFTAWNFLGTISWFGKKQVLDLLFNLYHGVTINAARAIATQVANATSLFVNSFTTAVNPQITKSYSVGDMQTTNNLIFKASKLSYFLLLLLAVPILLNIDLLLNFWLGVVPPFSVDFSRIEVLVVLLDSISMPLITLVLATGKVRNYQLLISGTSIALLPISFFMLKWGLSPTTVLSINVVHSIIAFIFRLIILKKETDFPVNPFCSNVCFPILKVTILALLLSYIVVVLPGDSFVIMLVRLVMSFIITIIIILCVGLNPHEREFVYNMIKNKLK